KPLFNRLNIRKFQRFLLDRYGARYLRESGRARQGMSRQRYEEETLALMGRARGTSYASLLSINTTGRRVAYDLQLMLPTGDVVNRDCWDFMRKRPSTDRIPFTRHLLWSVYLLRHNVNPAELAWPPGHGHCATVYDIPFHLPDNAPPELTALKERFLREGWPIRLVRIDGAEEPAFREFIRARFPSLAAFNQVANTAYARWEDVPFHREAPRDASVVEQTQWRNFVAQLPRERWTLLATETAYQDFLIGKYGSVRAIESRYGRAIPDLRELRLPIVEADYVYYRQHRGRFLWEFLTRNYVTAIEYMALRGRAFGNTVVLLVLSMLAALTINPLAAYALSRFRPRYTYQLLLVFLATMAFPPMVAAIPSFLLLRDLGMLNSYSALILPTVANGYSIFLLKGFFDSLPQELYEAASIDGASEARMFFVISLPLVKPILAVIALNTFIATYGGYMWALIVCQKKEMWTISVWMFQFYQEYGLTMPYLATAGMVLVSLPTLLVFVFCQKMILRGIVIPTMK
ncbi:MAG: carbohydrate ABC transporter permease, partial [Kiritimatiellae bacterium]|nr:carbohydrate ABC transporter permease [Kiritimatiellia bacterium]